VNCRAKKITIDIERWFQESARVFPWRESCTPWGRLVCEFMAQQTQIERVASRWPLMMDRFPTPESLAVSDMEDILELWQGLGYYRRAKHLKQTSEMIIDVFGGEVPCEVESLLQLPGVGRYTAGAVASIAFNKRASIVDANVHRVVCRIENKNDVSVPCNWSWEQATELVLSCTFPNVFNEALMELGATVCTPKSPSCDWCPISDKCNAFAENTQNEVLQAKSSLSRKRLHHYAVVLTCKGRRAFEKRDDHGLWAGMWQVPTLESSKKLPKAQIAEGLHLKGNLTFAGSFEHTLTHRIINFTVYTCEVGLDNRFAWHTSDTLDSMPLSSAQRKVLAVHCAV